MLAIFLALAISAAPASNPCAYDRDRLLGLVQQAFDQDLEGGWRPLADIPQCRIAAADLIRDYRAAHPATPSILFWHEGQLRAMAGQTAQAIPLLEHARKPADDAIGWNHYVDGTLAFLRRDRAALLETRDALAKQPRSSDFAPRDPSGHLLDMPWPPNLNVLDGLLKCFDRSYAEAYGPGCSQPIVIHVPPK